MKYLLGWCVSPVFMQSYVLLWLGQFRVIIPVSCTSQLEMFLFLWIIFNSWWITQSFTTSSLWRKVYTTQHKVNYFNSLKNTRFTFPGFALDMFWGFPKSFHNRWLMSELTIEKKEGVYWFCLQRETLNHNKHGD